MACKLFDGWLGEKRVQFYFWLTLDAKMYQRCHNVIVPSPDGTTQVDHVLVSSFGIFVVETKNFKGWIFGAEQDVQWTQSFPGGNKFGFQNPLRQNYRHTQCLAEYLGLEHEVFHSVIFFIGAGEIKTSLPPKVVTMGTAAYYIRSFTQALLPPAEVQRAIERLRSAKATQNYFSHRKLLSERHGSATICPKCGGTLVKRTAQRGSNAGKTFLGCSNFPACRFIKKSG
jgi:restriction system protein